MQQTHKLHESELYVKIHFIPRSKYTLSSHVAGDKMNAYRFSVRKPERERPLGRSRRRWDVMLKCMLQNYGGRG